MDNESVLPFSFRVLSKNLCFVLWGKNCLLIVGTCSIDKNIAYGTFRMHMAVHSISNRHRLLSLTQNQGKACLYASAKATLYDKKIATVVI